MKNPATHTPGPWTVKEHREHLHIYTDGVQVDHHIFERDNPEDVANARLIAEAPNMLVALQTIAGWCRCQCAAVHGDRPDTCPVTIAEAAIKQATNDR